jgi:hypothetical protein
MAAEVRFEAEKGWVPVNTAGNVWRYRAHGSAGVIVFQRAEDGTRLYEATHLDSSSSDTTITTPSRRKALRFAVTGSTAREPKAV